MAQVFDSAVKQYVFTEVVPQLNQPAAKISVKLAASVTYPQGTVIGMVTASPGVWGTYASGNSDGTQLAEAILPRQYTTDASGNIFAGPTATSEFGDSRTEVSAYFGGIYLYADLPNVDATAVTAMGGKKIANGKYLKF